MISPASVRKLARDYHQGELLRDDYRARRRAVIDEFVRETERGPATAQPGTYQGGAGQEMTDHPTPEEPLRGLTYPGLESGLLVPQPQADDLSIALSGVGGLEPKHTLAHSSRSQGRSEDDRPVDEGTSTIDRNSPEAIEVDSASVNSKTATSKESAGPAATRHGPRLLFLVLTLGAAFTVYQYDRDLSVTASVTNHAMDWLRSVAASFLARN